MKACIRCKVNKNLSCFWKHPQKKDGRYPSCKACNSVRRKKVQSPQERKENRDMRNRLRRTGCSSELYIKFKIAQKNCCAICHQHRSLQKKELAADHCHKTGKIRGLLCNNCNTGLGMFKENAMLLENAANYIKS